jgi:hypothetical protein
MFKKINSSNYFLKFKSTKIVSWLKNLLTRIKIFEKETLTSASTNTRFLTSYYSTNEKIWLEGLLIDWLQKSLFDKWLNRFLIHSSYLFSERVVFDFTVRFYLDYVIWLFSSKTIFTFQSISNILLTIVLFVSLFVILSNVLFLSYVVIS